MANVENNVILSIIVPIYNVEKYLCNCIDSILSQTFRDFELILVNDGSPDQCGNICDQYAHLDDRIKVIHKKNGGLSDARNAGIEIAKGEYIGFIDADDYVSETMYEKLIASCTQYNAEIAICGRFIVDDSKKILREEFTKDSIEVYDSETAIGNLLLWNTCDSAAWDKVYKRNLFKKIRYPLGVMSEDYDVTSRLFSIANRIVHVGEPLYYYVQRGGSITKQPFNKKRFETIYQVYRLCDFVNNSFPELQDKSKYFLSFHLISLQRYALLSSSSQYKEETKLLIKECMSNINNVISCSYNSVGQKVKFYIRIIWLKIHLLRLS